MPGERQETHQAAESRGADVTVGEAIEQREAHAPPPPPPELETGSGAPALDEPMVEALRGPAEADSWEELAAPPLAAIEEVPEPVEGPIAPSSDEDEFGFPTMRDVPTPAVIGVPDEPVAEPGGRPLEQVSERETGEGWISLGVAPAGDTHLPLPGALPEEEVGSEEGVARVLESLARRVRAGEISLPSGVSGASEGAVLAGLLAALLSAPETGAPYGGVEIAEPVEGR